MKGKIAELDRQESLRKEFRRNRMSEIQNFERIKRELDEKKELLRANLRAKKSDNITERAAARYLALFLIKALFRLSYNYQTFGK